MSDQFLIEQHAATLYQRAQPADDKQSWVMLTEDGGIVKKPNEDILWSMPRVGLELTTPPELHVTDPFALKSDSGMLYITTDRIIYLPTRPTENFKSFFAPILNFDDMGRVETSWFGPWSWSGLVRPVAAGGVPNRIPRLKVKLIFKEGGHSVFVEKLNEQQMKLRRARELGLVPSANTEPPPPYEGPSSGSIAADTSVPATGSVAPVVAGELLAAEVAQPPRPVPNEPPPDYAEVQSQAVAIQLEDELRGETER